ncbi:MAG TPA: 50S ribosomal protein L3 [Caldisericia bacterium]|nr:50S ribosomal protein L3 [Caldisericia bacterium]HPF49280.1 50S ribosomal protein L3 [Caldisericia bacterium]HPI84040.1 50S ribosomal protein L3 [Caldisericia bacterium]HPQ93298.1 50S ribosomal protein L3 [Caldisericia bacterium]HRV75320.1 50S ribosomal protein L3 [Caldisericia bacterium]
MAKGLITKKIGCTQIWEEDRCTMVTVLAVEDNVVLTQKTEKTDGYKAVKIGYRLPRNASQYVAKPIRAQYEKRNLKVHKKMMEIRDMEAEVGSSLKPDLFEAGEKVSVIGISRGLGFAGAVKRYHFRGGEAAHGAMMHRRTGSIGCRLTPGHVIKGKHMPGHMGSERKTVKNLRVVSVDNDKGLILLAGPVPGSKGSDVVVMGK